MILLIDCRGKSEQQFSGIECLLGGAQVEFEEKQGKIISQFEICQAKYEFAGVRRLGDAQVKSEKAQAEIMSQFKHYQEKSQKELADTRRLLEVEQVKSEKARAEIKDCREKSQQVVDNMRELKDEQAKSEKVQAERMDLLEQFLAEVYYEQAGTISLLKQNLEALASNDSLYDYNPATYADGRQRKQSTLYLDAPSVLCDSSHKSPSGSVPVKKSPKGCFISESCSLVQSSQPGFTDDSFKSTSGPQVSSSNSPDVDQAENSDSRIEPLESKTKATTDNASHNAVSESIQSKAKDPTTTVESSSSHSRPTIPVATKSCTPQSRDRLNIPRSSQAPMLPRS